MKIDSLEGPGSFENRIRKGDKPGHPFRGNQYTGSTGGRGSDMNDDGEDQYATFERFELNMTLDQASSVSGQGRQDENVAELLKDPKISAQLDAIGPGPIAAELREYGAWDDDELKDDAQNRARIVWIAGGNVTEDRYEREREAKRKGDYPGHPFRGNQYTVVSVGDEGYAIQGTRADDDDPDRPSTVVPHEASGERYQSREEAASRAAALNAAVGAVTTGQTGGMSRPGAMMLDEIPTRDHDTPASGAPRGRGVVMQGRTVAEIINARGLGNKPVANPMKPESKKQWKARQPKVQYLSGPLAAKSDVPGEPAVFSMGWASGGAPKVVGKTMGYGKKPKKRITLEETIEAGIARHKQ